MRLKYRATIACTAQNCRCVEELLFPMDEATTEAFVQMAIAEFQRRGWRCGLGISKELCPTCNKERVS